MAIALYMDVHVPQAITSQLRRRGVDVLTAVDDETQEFPDDKLLQRAAEIKRVLFTQDIRFRVLAETWQIEGKNFSGLIFGHQLGGTIGQFVKDLEFIAKVSEIDEWINVIEYIPFR
ncbi:conserved hypothetical protein [Trichormus variabilis ATCC 29413]|uniref:DUF5615 domain-containing protein n=2 Tax=Anabaena variabilis TaxID=264691 RepID=Q3MCD8_TRIV2|nr:MULTISPECIES: DUF5615 family PIN-like protein [Nostocaceae]ABA21348.1 conserved hypothetical protein [Trichormus variabilis ATCC 29413]MBC1213651.1 DUF5615 family PIN-like protein [Trichormus variabilis ARAD]MBC1254002.1 DUF5615 family PIN-like protein [Trichormus variabilis V5]MBC1267755.1 DUF5615 family PIN-like protein [Trichormus variabilis FSR]MBC1302109.1 DUF5615 family PIN-like protein [Trichormus variabilis N2B]